MSKGFFGSITEFFTNEAPIQSQEIGNVKGVSTVADAPATTIPTPPPLPTAPVRNNTTTPEWNDFLEKKDSSLHDVISDPSPRAVFTDVKAPDETLNLSEPEGVVEVNEQNPDLRNSSISSADAVLDLEGPAVVHEEEHKESLPELPQMDEPTASPAFKGMAPEKLEKLRTFFEMQRQEDAKALEQMKASLQTLEEAQQKHTQEKEAKLSEIAAKEQALKDERTQVEQGFENTARERTTQISSTTSQITEKEVQLKLEQDHFDKAIRDLSSDQAA